MDHKQNSSYILTLDAYRLNDVLAHTGVRVNPDTIKSMDDRLAARLTRIFEGSKLHIVDIRDLARDMRNIVNRSMQIWPNAKIVTTNPFLCQWPNCPRDNGRNCCLNVNRIVAPSGTDLGIGPRPWNDPIHKQIEVLAEELDGRPIILMEDGSWSGSTVVTLVDHCRQYSIEIVDLVCGIMFQRGYDEITSVYHKKPMYVHFHPNCIDWMPDHDFFPFFPCCGKIVGHTDQTLGHHLPHRLNGLSHAIPYILPYANPTDWASIPKSEAFSFSTECLSDTIDFFDELEVLNGGEPIYDTFTIGLYPRVSVPHRKTEELPKIHRERRIVDILRADYASLKGEMQ